MNVFQTQRPSDFSQQTLKPVTGETPATNDALFHICVQVTHATEPACVKPAH